MDESTRQSIETADADADRLVENAARERESRRLAARSEAARLGALSAAERLAENAAREREFCGEQASAAGLAYGLHKAQWEVSYNSIADCIDCRPLGAELWTECTGIVRHRMLEDLAFAVKLRPWKPGVLGTEPWRVGPRLEDRLLACVAGQNVRTGDGGPVYDAIARMLAEDFSTEYPNLTAVIAAAQINTPNEPAARTPKWIYRLARMALIQSGWVQQSVRTDAGPRKRWIRSTDQHIPPDTGVVV